MKLRTQTILIVATISLLVFLLLHIIAVALIMPGFNSVDNQSCSESLQQANSVLRYRLSQLEQSTRDYGWWDDTYNYVQTHDPNYIESNFADSTFMNLNLRMVVIFDKSSNLQFFKQYSPSGDYWSKIETDNLILNCQNITFVTNNATVSGLLLVNNQPLMIAVTPVLTSSTEGPSEGRIAFGTQLDNQEIAALERISDLNFSIYPMGNFNQNNNQVAQQLLLSPSTAVLGINNEATLSGFAVLKDINSNPAFVLQINHQRTAYQQGAWVRNLFIACSILISLIFGASILFILERKIIKPMNKLAVSVKGVPFESQEIEKGRFGADEINILSYAVRDSLNKKMDAMLEVSRMVAHDLRNPLSGIRNANYILKKNYRPVLDSRGNLMLDTIDDCVDYSDKIVKDLLDYSAKITLDKVMASIRGLINSSLETFMLPSNIFVKNEVPEEILAVIDADKMRRVFANLISNAIDAMPDGGRLVISGKKEGKYTVVEFTDNGFGMSEDTLKKLWTPFFTTKAKGMGIGLPIVKRLIEAHGGKLEVKSKVGKGTTFIIHLPNS